MSFLSSILPIAGTVIGTAFGGPAGGAIGGAIGGAAGNAAGGGKNGGIIQSAFGSQPQLYNKNPDWLNTASQNVFQNAADSANIPYQAYGGERVAPLSSNQAMATTNAANAIGRFAPEYGAITDYLNNSAKGYDKTYTPTAVGYDNVSTTNNPQAITTMDWTQANHGAYMNPYLEDSLAPQLAGINQDYALRKNASDAKAGGSGNFGNSRALINRDILLGKQQEDALSGTRAQGYNTAYNTGLQAFQSDQGRNLQGQQSQADIFAQDRARKLQADLANQAAGINTGEFNETANSKAFDTNYNVFKGNADAQRQAAAGLTNLTTTKQNNTNAIQKNLLDTGALQQGVQQQQDTANYQDFLEQRGYGKEQAAYLASILSASPAKGSISNGQNVNGNDGVANAAGQLGSLANSIFGQGGTKGMQSNPISWINPDKGGGISGSGLDSLLSDMSFG